MEESSKYNVEVESILGGLESALARGQPLNKAMTSFRNAGYKRENIEEASRKFQVLHRRKFHELGVDPNKPKRIVGAVSQYGTYEKEKPKKPVPKRLVPAKTRDQLIEQYEREKLEIEYKKPSPHRKIVRKVKEEKKQDSEEKESGESDGRPVKRRSFREPRRKPEKLEKPPKKKQVVSGYGDDALKASENFRDAVEEAVKSLSKLSLPQQASTKKQKPRVVNKISNYGMKPPTPVNKAVTFLLIFLLILLLGVLAAVFFFKEELIDLFNTFSLE